MSNRSIFRIYSVWLIVPFWNNFISVTSIFFSYFRSVEEAIEKLSIFSCYICFNLFSKAVLQRSFSKTHPLTKLSKWCFTGPYINMDASHTGVYIGRYLYCKTKLGYPCSMEGVFQIEKQIWQKLKEKVSLNPVSISILEVLKTRSRISNRTFITLTCVKCMLMLWVSLIRFQ